MFDNSSPLGKAILGKLSIVIDQYNQGKGLPSLGGMSRADLDLAKEL